MTPSICFENHHKDRVAVGTTAATGREPLQRPVTGRPPRHVPRALSTPPTCAGLSPRPRSCWFPFLFSVPARSYLTSYTASLHIPSPVSPSSPVQVNLSPSSFSTCPRPFTQAVPEASTPTASGRAHNNLSSPRPCNFTSTDSSAPSPLGWPPGVCPLGLSSDSVRTASPSRAAQASRNPPGCSGRGWRTAIPRPVTHFQRSAVSERTGGASSSAPCSLPLTPWPLRNAGRSWTASRCILPAALTAVTATRESSLQAVKGHSSDASAAYSSGEYRLITTW